MSLGNTLENDLLKLLYNATPIANIADNAISAPFVNIYIALHTADPGDAGDQTTSEAAYTSYTRVPVARTTGGWIVTANSVSPVAAITFPAATGGSEAILYFSAGVAASGASKIIHRGPLGSIQGPFTASTNDDITIPGHTLSIDDRIAFFPSYDSSLPSGITEGTAYWVKTAAINVITVSTTQGGSTLDVTAVGDGVAWKVTPIPVSPGTTPIISATTTLKID